MMRCAAVSRKMRLDGTLTKKNEETSVSFNGYEFAWRNFWLLFHWFGGDG